MAIKHDKEQILLSAAMSVTNGEKINDDNKGNGEENKKCAERMSLVLPVGGAALNMMHSLWQR